MLLGLVFSILALSGCNLQEETPESSLPEESLVPLENTGASVSLVIAYTDLDRDTLEVLEEIIAKYQADFPETGITLRACDTPGQVQAMLRDGEADLAQVADADQVEYVAEGLLLDFSPYLKSWKEGNDLTNAARYALRSMGGDHAYILPADFTQEILFYRADWLDACNAPLHRDEKVYLRNWHQLERAKSLMGDQASLAIGGKGRLGFYFDAMLWSRLKDGMLDTAAAYFSTEEGETLSSLEGAEEAAEKFKSIFETVALPGCAGWTEEQAVAAFKEGKAGLLLADSSYYEELEAALPPGALGTDGFVRDRITGIAVTGAGFWGWAVSAAAKDPGTAVHFLTYLSAADNNTYLAKTTGSLPIHTEALEMEPSLEEGLRGPEIQQIRQGSQRQYAQRPIMYRDEWEAFSPWYEELLQGYLAGETDAAGVLEELDGYWGRVYKEQGTGSWKVEKEEVG